MVFARPEIQSDPVDSPLGFLARFGGWAVWLSVALLVPAAMALVALVPFAFNTLHVQDTMFFADLGWRVLHGLTPTLDFGHFYGGVVAHYVAWAFALFGVDAKAIDYAFLLMLASVAGFAFVLCLRRTSRLGMVALMLVIAACLLARVPLEMMTAVQKPVAAHSFIYNRLAITIVLPLSLFALLRADVKVLELMAGLLAGAGAFVLVLIKPTFITFVPFFVLALVVMQRWPALLAVAVGFVLTLLIVDPGAAKARAAFDYATASTAAAVSIPELLFKCVGVFLVHPLALFSTLAALLLSVRVCTTQALAGGVATLLLAAGFAGMTATMGWQGDIGQQTLPFMAVIVLALAERIAAVGAHADRAHSVPFVQVLALMSALAFSLPQLAQTCLSGVFALSKARLIQTTQTPLDSYLAWSDDLRDAQGRKITAATPWEAQVAATVAHLEAGKKTNAGVQYVQIIDGVRLLQSLPDIATRGVAGDLGAFAYALQTQPIAAYPTWVSSNAPELKSDRPLPAEIDVMILRNQGVSKTTQLLRTKMGDDFVRCVSSPLWTAYVHRDSAQDSCDP